MVPVAPAAEHGAAPAIGAVAMPARTIPAPPSMAMPLNFILMFSFRRARRTARGFPVPEIQRTRANPGETASEQHASGADACRMGRVGRVTHRGCEFTLKFTYSAKAACRSE